MIDWIPYREPPLQELNLPTAQAANVKVVVRREDFNHPLISGNKWWKLKYNLVGALHQKHDRVLTFGGAYSNHIYATAAACQALGLKSIGVIRGEKVLPLNSTLAFAENCGMELHFISRDDYRIKSVQEFQSKLEKKLGRCYIIPEGGTNIQAVQGTEELGRLLLKVEFDYLCLPIGTGGTMAGIIKAFEGRRKIIGIPVLKHAGFLRDEIQSLLPHHLDNWQLLLDYHHGGYAKTNQGLELYLKEITQYGIPTEHVYTGKLFWAVDDLLRKGFFESGRTVLVLHTGGLR